MKKNYLLPILLLLTHTAFAQKLSILSMKGLNANKTIQVNRNYFITPDGGIIINGKTLATVANFEVSCVSGMVHSEIIFQKYDSTGSNLIWEKCYPKTLDTLVQYIFPLSSGCTVEAGRQGVNASGAANAMIRKADMNGNILWNKIYYIGGGLPSIIPTNDGGFIMIGSPTDTGGEVHMHYGPSMTSDIFALKVDSNGNKLWSKVIGGSADDEPLKVIANSEGGCYIVGSTFSNDYDCIGGHAIPWMYNDAYVVKLDGNGNILWHRSMGGSYKDFFSSACDDGKGGILAIGSTSSDDHDVSNYIGNIDYWLVHLDSLGNILWDRCYGTPQYSETSSSLTGEAEISRSETGNIYLLLYAEAPFASQEDTSYGGGDALVIKLDSLGNIIGSRTLGSPKFDRIGMIASLKTGVVLVGGAYTSSGNTGTMPPVWWPNSDTLIYNNYNGFLIRIAPWSTSINDTNLNRKKILTVYPNPASDNFTIAVNDKQKGILSITNSQGREIYKQILAIGNITQTIQTASWTKGLYLILWKNGEGVTITQKILII